MQRTMAGASPPTPKRESFASAGKLRADTEEELVATKELLKQGTTMEKMTTAKAGKTDDGGGTISKIM